MVNDPSLIPTHTLEYHGKGPIHTRNGLWTGGAATLCLSRWIFLRLLGVVYLIEFVSFGTQIQGLIGEDSILPAGDYLKAVYGIYGRRGYYSHPTLFWFSTSNVFLQLHRGCGVLLSLMLIIGLAPIPVLLLLGIFYLSLVAVGQDFLQFQWDILLLETGLIATFYAPLRCILGIRHERSPSTMVR